MQLIAAQKMKFPMKGFFSKCDQIRSFLWIWSHLLKKSFMENLILCAMYIQIKLPHDELQVQWLKYPTSWNNRLKRLKIQCQCSFFLIVNYGDTSARCKRMYFPISTFCNFLALCIPTMIVRFCTKIGAR